MLRQFILYGLGGLLMLGIVIWHYRSNYRSAPCQSKVGHGFGSLASRLDRFMAFKNKGAGICVSGIALLTKSVVGGFPRSQAAERRVSALGYAGERIVGMASSGALFRENRATSLSSALRAL